MNQMIGFSEEPRRGTYSELLHAGLECCERCLLVVRDHSWLDDRAHRVLASLEPFLISRVERSEWPGTELLSDTAQVLTYRYTEQTKEILGRAVDGLYDWVLPLPEDLCLMAENEPWLVSVAHEKDAYLVVSDEELSQLLRRHPSLAEVIGSHGRKSGDS